MAARNFAASLAFTLVYEGGFVDHAKDPGGATRFGATSGSYRCKACGKRCTVHVESDDASCACQLTPEAL